RVMQAVGEHVQRGLAPGHELAVVPDDPLEAVVRFFCHGASPRGRSGARGRRIVPYAFASRVGPRYGSARPTRRTCASAPIRSGLGRGHDPFVAALCWITV